MSRSVLTLSAARAASGAPSRPASSRMSSRHLCNSQHVIGCKHISVPVQKDGKHAKCSVTLADATISSCPETPLSCGVIFDKRAILVSQARAGIWQQRRDVCAPSMVNLIARSSVAPYSAHLYVKARYISNLPLPWMALDLTLDEFY